MDEGVQILLMVVVTIITLTSIITVGVIYDLDKRRATFENTITEVTEEQRCLHICGFQFSGYLENYKFCIEKCDRISERIIEAKYGECK